MVKIAIIGGSGLENPEILKNSRDFIVNTYYGDVILKEGLINNLKVTILSRHGPEHNIAPSNINYRANILALKQIGITHILATTAVGSLREDIIPGDIVFPSQFIDFTKIRPLTFFDKDKVVHTSLADPYCPALTQLAVKIAKKLKLKYHTSKTLVTIEGPRFSTRAESHLFRKLGADIINMSGVPETQLAREAGLCYLSVAMPTDYDCWRLNDDPVSYDAVMKIMSKNAEKVTKLIIEMIPLIKRTDCGCNINMDETINNLANIKSIKSFIRSISDYPKKGIIFRDVTTLFKDKDGLKLTIDKLTRIYKDKKIDKIVGIESRGFILASALAYNIGAGLVLARKPNKLPCKKISQSYKLEYGSDKLEMHTDSIKKGESVVIVDDLIATGGTAQATAKLVEKLGGKIDSFAFVVALPNLKGKNKLSKYKIHTLVEFEGD